MTSAPSGSQVPLIAGIALAVLIAGAAGCSLAFRAGLRAAEAAAAAEASGAISAAGTGSGDGPPFPVPGWRAGSSGVAVVLIVVHAVIQPSGSAAPGGSVAADQRAGG